MLQPTTIQFLSNLAQHHTKEWFDANRKSYEAAKTNFLQLTAQVLNQLSELDATIAHVAPKECVFRINRDVRFSKNKDPYKNNMGISITKGGKNSIFAGYYFHCQPGGESFVGGGLYMAMPNEMKKLRQEIDYCWEEFNGIITDEAFKTVYGNLEKQPSFSLTRPPKGYEADNPAIEYIKLKSWVATKPVADSMLVDEQLVSQIIGNFSALKPLLDFINRAIV